MLKREDILKELKDILLYADPGNASLINQCTGSERLVEDLGLTSVNILFLVISIEDAFEIRFEDVGVADFPTLDDVINYIEEHAK